MTVYKSLISAEKNSLNELRLNYLTDIDVLEKICACSIAAKLNDELNDIDYNVIVISSDPNFDYALQIDDDRVLAYTSEFIKVGDKIPVFDMIKSIRTISSYV